MWVSVCLNSKVLDVWCDRACLLAGRTGGVVCVRVRVLHVGSKEEWKCMCLQCEEAVSGSFGPSFEWPVSSSLLAHTQLLWMHRVCTSCAALSRSNSKQSSRKDGSSPLSWRVCSTLPKTPLCDLPSGCEMSTSTSPHVAFPRRYEPQAIATRRGSMAKTASFTCTSQSPKSDGADFHFGFPTRARGGMGERVEVSASELWMCFLPKFWEVGLLRCSTLFWRAWGRTDALHIYLVCLTIWQRQRTDESKVTKFEESSPCAQHSGVNRYLASERYRNFKEVVFFPLRYVSFFFFFFFREQHLFFPSTSSAGGGWHKHAENLFFTYFCEFEAVFLFLITVAKHYD